MLSCTKLLSIYVYGSTRQYIPQRDSEPPESGPHYAIGHESSRLKYSGECGETLVMYQPRGGKALSNDAGEDELPSASRAAGLYGALSGTEVERSI